MDYYSILDRIKETASRLQGLPIPTGEIEQGKNLGRLELAAEALRLMLVEVVDAYPESKRTKRV